MVNLKKNGFNPIGLDNFNSYYSVSLKRSRADYVKATTPGSDIIDGELCDADLIHSIFSNRLAAIIKSSAARLSAA